MKTDLSALEAKIEAQKIAFSPIYFQAIMAMSQLGILQLLRKNKKGLKISAIADELNLSLYGVNILIEAGANINVVEFIEPDLVVLTTIGYLINSDRMTQVNFNFVNDVCYNGAKYLTESIKTGKPEGLKTLGDWKTLYEGLMQFPEKVKDSWLDFDHYYSDNAFNAALQIVFKKQTKYLFDIGGNTGKWALGCCKFNTEVRIKILDLQEQLNIAKKNIDANGFSERVDFHPINLLDNNNKIPGGADTIWMSQFLDCFSPEEIVAILKKVHDAVDNDTNIYILEPFIDNQKFDSAAYCLVGTSLYFTTMANGNSKMYSLKAMEKLINEAGLKIIRTYPLIDDTHQTLLQCVKES